MRSDKSPFARFWQYTSETFSIWVLKPSYPQESSILKTIICVSEGTCKFDNELCDYIEGILVDFPKTEGGTSKHTLSSMVESKALGPVANPIRIPGDRIVDKLSNRSTRPTSGSSTSREK
jgi:hypothetical protein